MTKAKVPLVRRRKSAKISGAEECLNTQTAPDRNGQTLTEGAHRVTAIPHSTPTDPVRTDNKVSPLYRIGIANRLSLRSYVTGYLSKCGRFALHPNPDWFDGFTVTHIPTGHCVARVGTKREASKVMSAFQQVKSPAWSWRHALKVSKAVRKEGRAICDRLRLPTGSEPTWNDATCREWVKTFVKPELIADILAEIDSPVPPANTEAVTNG